MQQNRPSGIAQLRKSSENLSHNTDIMNLDDFIFSDNPSTPLDISFSPHPKPESSYAAYAIPIKSRKDQEQELYHQHHQQQQEHEHDQFVPQSVPEHHRDVEFNYVKRHQRKTSIDERRVSIDPYCPLPDLGDNLALRLNCSFMPLRPSFFVYLGPSHARPATTS